MSKSTEIPHYRPAPHLTNTSFLTTEQLVLYFKDFYESLERAPGAPDLVFDRLVANLGNAFSSSASYQRDDVDCPEREEILSAIDKLVIEVAELRVTTAIVNSGDEGIHQRSQDPPESSNARLYAEVAELKTKITRFERQSKKQTTLDSSYFELRLSNERLKVEVEELKKVNGELTEVVTKLGLPKSSTKYPGIGVFTNYNSHVAFGKTGSAKVPFTKQYHTPPVLSLGLTRVSIDNGSGLHLFINNIRNLNYLLTISPCENGNLNDAECSWLEIEHDDADFQAGTVEHSWSPTATATHAVLFPRKYTTPPQVVAFFRDFSFTSNSSKSMYTFPSNITTEGFELRIEVTQDCELKYASISWVACTKDKAGVVTGCVQTSKKSPGDIFNHNGRGHVQFPSGTFSEPPRVMMGINRIATDLTNRLLAAVRASDITADDMTWGVSFDNGNRVSIGFSYIALR